MLTEEERSGKGEEEKIDLNFRSFLEEMGFSMAKNAETQADFLLENMRGYVRL